MKHDVEEILDEGSVASNGEPHLPHNIASSLARRSNLWSFAVARASYEIIFSQRAYNLFVCSTRR